MLKIQNAVEFINITKYFPGIKANDNISFKIKKGTIHAIIGENGAGKSTLMSILFGLISQTEGQIKINDQNVFIKDPNDANDLGIGMVHQHFKLVDVYTNLQNIIIGAEYQQKLMINEKSSILKIQAIQDKYNLNFDLKEKTGNATVSTQQKVEILKMLYRDNEILVFDEPTAVLTDIEIKGLLETFKIFKQQGKTIIFISHKLKEVKDVADFATVIRNGKLIGNYDVKNVSINELASAMVGEIINLPSNTSNEKFGKTVLSFKNVFFQNNNKKVEDISFDIRAGEILAIAGVEGNGQEIIEFLASGIIKPKKGQIIFNDKKINNLSIAKKTKLKISYIPSDRQKYGLVLDFDINENAILRRLSDKEFNKFAFIRTKNRDKFSKEIIQKFDVRGAQEGTSAARSLSGGNQQKVIVGREMLTTHDLLVVMQPTRGLDIGAINQIHKKIIDEKKMGKAILLISYELDEVLALADTILVISKGKIQGITNKNDVTREQIGLWMANIKETQPSQEREHSE